MTFTRRSTVVAGLALAAGTPAARAQLSTSHLAERGRAALDRLYAAEPNTQFYARRAKGVLIFPSIIKGGLIWGAETGNGVLFLGGRVASYYNTSAASFGLQIGGQEFSLAMFFMNDRGLGYLHRSGGFALGTEPNVVVVTAGAAAVANSTTLTQDIYVFPFGQKGLMAGIDIHGSKITPISGG
ncbi:MAG TPA: YSC84-related protein [Caulobacteraceae bacterium]